MIVYFLDWERNSLKINTYLRGTKSTASSEVDKTTRQNQIKGITSTITMDRWETYFKALLTRNSTEYKINKEHKPILGR